MASSTNPDDRYRVIHTDPAGRYRIRFEPNRKVKKYIVVFTKKWADTVDPAKGSPELRARKSFPTQTEGKHYGKTKSDQADRFGQLANLSVSLQAQILGLAEDFTAAGGDPASLLTTAKKIKESGICPIFSMIEGSQLIEVAEGHINDTLGHWIEKYANDPRKQKNRTHSMAVSNLRHYEGLGEIKLKHLQTEKKAYAVLTPVLQKYVDRPKVKRLKALQNMRNRLRQLFSYTNTHTQLPPKHVINSLSRLDSYKDLHHDLSRGKEDYSLSAAEILVMIKHFSQRESFCPTYPVIAALMGARTSMYTELSWLHMGGKGRLGDATVNIPRTLLKTVRQNKTSRGIKFLMKEIPNLSKWLWWCALLECVYGFKRHPLMKSDLLRTMKPQHIREERNKCLLNWKHFFECEVEDSDDYNWNNAAYNGFRNSFITFGVRHPVLRNNVSKIADDYKSHKHYVDQGTADTDLDARVLWEMNPFYLPLVDMDAKTVDTAFIYADLTEKKNLWAKEKNEDRKQVYRLILESHNVYPDQNSWGARLANGSEALIDVVVDFMNEVLVQFFPQHTLFEQIPKDHVMLLFDCLCTVTERDPHLFLNALQEVEKKESK